MKKTLAILFFLFAAISFSQTICTSFNPTNFVLNGNAAVTNSPEVTLTNDQGNLYGTMWSNQEILFDEDFLIQSELFFGFNDWGADGIAFVLQPQSSNAGGAGGGIGYADITPSLAIEFDTYFNTGSDPITNDHVAIIKNGQPYSIGLHSEFITPVDIGNVENGQWHTASFEWTASTQKLKLIFDGIQLFDVTIDLAAIFPTNNSVFWGFTSATGGANNLHKVKINNYCVTLDPNITEICNDGLDNDNDGFIDGFDSDCPCVDNTFFNICQPDCQIDFTPEPLSIIQNWSSSAAIITMSSIVSGDINNDGMPEIVALGTTGMTINNPRITSGINIFNGSNGSLISTFSTPYSYWEAPGSILIADINNDGLGEIIFASSTSGNNAINQRYLFCYGINGNLIWKSNVQYGANTPGNNKGGGSLGIADFNYDGIPEVYIFNEIFNAQTGVKLVDGGNNGIGRMETTLNNLQNGVYSLTVAGDLTNNAGLELAAGKTVYNVTITNTNGTTGNSMFPINNTLNRDGFTSIADINLDGNLDVIVSCSGNSSNSILYIWNPNTNNIISSINLPTGSNLDMVGVPFVGDMDNDGAPEIGVCRPYKLLTYKFINNNLVLKWELITTDYSGATKISMFDFNQDGIQEIIYRDETQLRIINGSGTTPIVLSNFPSLSGTALEGPIICDINNDNQSNILITSDDPTLGPFKGRIQCFKSNGQPWAPSRKVWNQYAYFNVNINDDLTVPIQQQNHGLQFYNTLGSCLGATLRPLNSFMAQETIRDITGCPIYPAPDLIISQVNNIVYDCTNQIISIDLTINNQGSTPILTDFNLMIFEGTNTTPGNFVHSQLVNVSLAPSAQTTITVNLSNFSLSAVFALLNFNNSNQVFPYNSVNECDYSNNFFNFSLIPQLITPTFTQIGPICSGATLSALPTTSTNSITGTWSPALNNTATTTYTFTPTTGQCATIATMTINVISTTVTPTGNSLQVFCANPVATVNQLSATGNNIQWYAVSTGGTPLASSTILVNGTNYYASQTVNGCESNTRLEVTVNINDPQITASANSICIGENVNLTVNYSNASLCNMNITPNAIPLGNPIPGFTYGGTFNGHYYYIYNTPTTWTAGELICRQNGGYLVCINDINENTFVSNLTNNNIWIGMFRDPTTCQFRWLDCMNITFTNWRPGEPNSGPCGEPYVQIIRGCSFGLNTWNNLSDNSSNGSCYSNMVPIMEIDPFYYNPTSVSLLWSTGETTPTINPTPTQTTVYWVDVTISGVTCRRYITITVNSLVTPTFNQLSSICNGTTINALPTTSVNGITGTWSPALDNTATTTYTFTPTVGQCASTTSMTITVNPNITPTFTQVPAICSGATLSALPSTSNNGIIGTWSPALDNTSTTLYTFTPNAGQCATTATMTITVNPLPAVPTGNPQQNFCAIDAPTINNLVINSSFTNWYLTSTGGTALPLSYVLIDGLVLYAASYDPITLCEHPTRFPVTIMVENPLLPSIQLQQEICKEKNITLGEINTNGVTMIWYDNAISGNVIPLTHVIQNGDIFYGAALNILSGCESTTRIPLEVTVFNSNLSFYNLISIDDNELNKELTIIGLEQFPNNSIEIFNRYGDLVWSGINYDNSTNTFKGMANVSGVVSVGSYLPSGTYFFILSYPNECEKSELKGFIHIDNKL